MLKSKGQVAVVSRSPSMKRCLSWSICERKSRLIRRRTTPSKHRPAWQRLYRPFPRRSRAAIVATDDEATQGVAMGGLLQLSAIVSGDMERCGRPTDAPLEATGERSGCESV